MSQELLDLGWAIGLFEGEGCISTGLKWSGRLPYRKQYEVATILLETTDFDVLQRFVVIVGVGRITGPMMRRGSTKPSWRWQVHRLDDVRRVLELFRPHLGERRQAKADYALLLLTRRGH